MAAVPPKELSGLRLEGEAWQMDGQGLLPEVFFKAVPCLLAGDDILVIQGGDHPPQLRKWLETKAIVPREKVAIGTIWPRPVVFHCPVSRDEIAELESLVKRCAEPEVADHVQLYVPGRVVLEWWNAFADPMYLSKQLGAGRVDAFCKSVGRPYTELINGLPPQW